MDTALIITLVTMGSSAVTGLTLAIWRFANRLATIEVRLDDNATKINVCWDFIMRRAASEAISRGEPLTLNEKARKWFANLAPDLKAFYLTRGQGLNDREFFIAIEKEFGSRILQEICIPNKLASGSCVVLAMQVAKETL